MLLVKELCLQAYHNFCEGERPCLYPLLSFLSPIVLEISFLRFEQVHSFRFPRPSFITLADDFLYLEYFISSIDAFLKSCEPTLYSVSSIFFIIFTYRFLRDFDSGRESLLGLCYTRCQDLGLVNIHPPIVIFGG